MTVITQPGLYTHIDAATYHADKICPTISLNSSVAKLLADLSPAHAWTAHPRLNPYYQPDKSRRLDLGSVAHALLLGKSRDLVEIEHPNYLTKDARALRDDAYEAGKIPVLTDDLSTAQAMADVAMKAIMGHGLLAWLFPDVFEPHIQSEPVMAWREGEQWCRSMIDRIAVNGITLVMDYKTCTCAEPAAVTRHLYEMGYHFQEAFYTRGLDAVFPESAGRRKFIFCFQEIKPPYAVSFLETDGAGKAMAARKVDYAINLWKECRAKNRWPAYETTTHVAQMPAYLEAKQLAREIEDEARGAALLPAM
jgi:PDDEXK-like domain of unknown function (DUF3799)